MHFGLYGRLPGALEAHRAVAHRASGDGEPHDA